MYIAEPHSQPEMREINSRPPKLPALAAFVGWPGLLTVLCRHFTYIFHLQEKAPFPPPPPPPLPFMQVFFFFSFPPQASKLERQFREKGENPFFGRERVRELCVASGVKITAREMWYAVGVYYIPHVYYCVMYYVIVQDAFLCFVNFVVLIRFSLSVFFFIRNI